MFAYTRGLIAVVASFSLYLSNNNVTLRDSVAIKSSNVSLHFTPNHLEYKMYCLIFEFPFYYLFVYTRNGCSRIYHLTPYLDGVATLRAHNKRLYRRPNINSHQIRRGIVAVIIIILFISKLLRLIGLRSDDIILK